MSIEVVKIGKAKADDDIVKALSELVEEARAGKIHSLVVVGVDKYEGVTHRIRHRIDATTIGSLSCLLQDLQREWNAG